MSGVDVLVDMGFDRKAAERALQLKGNNVSAAVDYLVRHAGDEAQTSSSQAAIVAPKGQWSCPACTFFNDNMFPYCRECSTPNPSFRSYPHSLRFGGGDGYFDEDDDVVIAGNSSDEEEKEEEEEEDKKSNTSTGSESTSKKIDGSEEKQRKLIADFQKDHKKELDALRDVFLSPACCTDSECQQAATPPPVLLESPAIVGLLKKYVPSISTMRDRRNIACVTDFIVSSYYKGLPLYNSIPAVKTHIMNALQHIIGFANDPVKSETEKKRHLTRLADAFTSCQAEQGRVIDTIYGLISGRTRGLREQILALVDEQKMRVMDAVIVEIHPEAAQKTLISSVQFPHLESSYIHAVGKQLGMRGVAGARVDRNITQLSQAEARDVVQRFRRIFSTFEVIQTFVDDVNQQGESNDRLISREDLLHWAGDESVNHGFNKFSVFYNEALDPSEYNDAKPTAESEYQPFLTRGVALDIFNKIFMC